MAIRMDDIDDMDVEEAPVSDAHGDVGPTDELPSTLELDLAARNRRLYITFCIVLYYIYRQALRAHAQVEDGASVAGHENSSNRASNPRAIQSPSPTTTSSSNVQRLVLRQYGATPRNNFVSSPNQLASTDVQDDRRRAFPQRTRIVPIAASYTAQERFLLSHDATSRRSEPIYPSIGLAFLCLLQTQVLRAFLYVARTCAQEAVVASNAGNDRRSISHQRPNQQARNVAASASKRVQQLLLQEGARNEVAPVVNQIEAEASNNGNDHVFRQEPNQQARSGVLASTTNRGQQPLLGDDATPRNAVVQAQRIYQEESTNQVIDDPTRQSQIVPETVSAFLREVASGASVEDAHRNVYGSHMNDEDRKKLDIIKTDAFRYLGELPVGNTDGTESLLAPSGSCYTRTVEENSLRATGTASWTGLGGGISYVTQASSDAQNIIDIEVNGTDTPIQSNLLYHHSHPNARSHSRLERDVDIEEEGPMNMALLRIAYHP